MTQQPPELSEKPQPEQNTAAAPKRIVQQIEIINKLGLHGRAATKLVTLVNQYQANVWIEKEARQVDAASVLGLLLLETCQGESIQVIAEGEDAENAVQAVCELINNRFDEAD